MKLTSTRMIAIAGAVILHVWALHVPGNNNPTGVEVQDVAKDTVPFHPYYTVKDAFAIVIFLIMFAVFNRFDKSYEEAARDQGATAWQTLRHVVLPIIAPSLIGVALFGFTLSYDEFARTLLTAGSYNTLPLEIFGMTTNVTTPVIYALGTLTTAFSFVIIAVFLVSVWVMGRRRARHGSDAGKSA